MNERIKLIRKQYDLSQEKFGERLGVTKSAISRMELGTYKVTDTMIKLICNNFSVNESWLRNGIGNMLIETSDTLIEQIKNQYNLSELDILLLTEYINLSDEQRNVLKTYFKNVFGKISTLNNEECACSYNDEIFVESRSIQERVAEAEREYEIKVLGKTSEQLETRDKVVEFSPCTDKENA